MNPSKIEYSLNLEHSYADQLPDSYAPVLPEPVRAPSLLQFNDSLANELGLGFEQLSNEQLAKIFAGNELPSDARPIAQAYAGHQFGSFVPQLGDGRALLLGEVVDRHGRRRDIALKGSGRTPFSRGGDGRAAVGPVLREYLIGEAMHALGIPTTRALAAVATGEPVMRDRPLPGAVLTRVAASHVRVGTFQYFAARRQNDQIQRLADYVIQRHFVEDLEDGDGEAAPYRSLLRCVVRRQAALVAQWMLVGFIHGVMNTDNTTISGETIDYGPCAFMESFDPNAVFSSIDHGGRYAYGNQPSIALWNLARFAETLLPLIDKNDRDHALAEATSILDSFAPTFEHHWYAGALKKLGLIGSHSSESAGEHEKALVDDWFALLESSGVDYTLAWRNLAEAAEGDPRQLSGMFTEQTKIEAWLDRWRQLQHDALPSKLAASIRAANPLYIPRNHLVEEALADAQEDGDLTRFHRLLKLLQQPFDEQPDSAHYALPAAAEFTADYRTFCGT